MAILIEDTFTEASPPVLLNLHTPEDGGSWTQDWVWDPLHAYEFAVDLGTLPTYGDVNVVQRTGLGATAYRHSENPGTQDLTLYFNIAVWDGARLNAGDNPRFHFRCALDFQNGYSIGYNQNHPFGGTTGLQLYRYDFGTITVIWNPIITWANDTFHELKLDVIGDELTIYEWQDPGGGFEWVQLGQITDSTFDGGAVLLAGGPGSAVAHAMIRVETVDVGPSKPTITIADQGPDFVEYDSSVFVYGVPNSGQKAAQWQVTLASDPTFASPIIDVTSENSDSFENFLASPLNLFLDQYIARVRHQDLLDRWSDWSDTSATSSLETAGQYYTAFAERPIGVNIRTDIPADWSELDPVTDESSWFLEPRNDATCQVTMDRVSLDGGTGTVDPILWEGFPSVAQQIVFGRFVFDTVQANLEPCDSGVADPTGIICRETYGLKELRYGPAGSGGINPAGDTSPYYMGASATLCPGPASSFSHDPGISLLDTDWVQIAIRCTDTDDPADLLVRSVYPWVGAGGGTVSQRHFCGRLWMQTCGVAFGGYGGGFIEPGRVSSCAGFGWAHTKIGPNDLGEPTRHLAWTSHLGLTGETRTFRFGDWTGGAFFWGCGDGCAYFQDPCSTGWGSAWACDEVIVCASNKVRILDLPFGWYCRIGGTGPHVSAPSGFWPMWITGDGSDDQLIDFVAFAFPADTIYLRDADGNTLAEWDVPTGIWGGDVYRIKPSIVGAAGVGARLAGTFEGSDGAGYIAYLEATGGLILAKWTAAGGLVTLDSAAFDIVTGTYYNVVLEAVGTTIRAKAWAGGAGLQGDPENNDPGTWTLSVTDSDHASGAPGLVGLTQNPVDFDAFAAGLGGDPYPTGRYPGACAWVNPTEDRQLEAGDSPLLLEWTPPPVTAGVLGGEIVYELEFQTSGDPGWAPLASNIRTTTYSWDLSSLPTGFYCVRVRAYAGCEYGPWSQVCFQWLGGLAVVPDGYFFGDWYTGEQDVGQWIRLFRASHLDDDVEVHGCLVTRELMPAGVGGECLFQKLYVTATVSTVAVMTVTPILDGDYLLEEQRSIGLDTYILDPITGEPIGGGEGGKFTKRYEIDLTEGFGDPEKFRHGYRGTYWQVEICVVDYQGAGRVEIDGVALKYTVVRETHAWARPFTGELEVDVVMETLSRFFFGTTTDDATAAIYLHGSSNTDFGERLQALAESNKFAPFGTTEDAWFRTLYVSVTRTNRADITIAVTPKLNDTTLETKSISLPAVGFGGVPVTEVHEIPLSVPAIVDDVEVGRYGARGVWFSYQIVTSSQLAEGELIFNGAALEAIPCRETEPGVT